MFPLASADLVFDSRDASSSGRSRAADVARSPDAHASAASEDRGTTGGERSREPARNRARDALALLLVALGFAQLAGNALARLGAGRLGRSLAAFAAASGCSPAPAADSLARGLERFSMVIDFEWDGADGAVHRVALSPALAARLRGPYARRCAYGAVLVRGPGLAADPATRPMIDAVLDRALAGEAPLLAELGVDASARTGPVRVRYAPSADAPGTALPIVLAPGRR